MCFHITYSVMMSAYHNTVKLNTWISNQFIISAFLRDKCCCYLNINTYSWLTFLNISKLWHGATSHNLLSDIIKGAVFKRGHALCDWSSTVLLTLSPRALLLDIFFILIFLYETLVVLFFLDDWCVQFHVHPQPQPSTSHSFKKNTERILKMYTAQMSA